MSLAYKLFLTFLYVRSAAIVNTGQHDISREKGLKFHPDSTRLRGGFDKILQLRSTCVLVIIAT